MTDIKSGGLSPLRVNYAVFILVLLTTLNYMDRFIFAMLIEPIKIEFGLSDTHMGLLFGLTFAIAYGAMTIPVGRLADRCNRVHIVSSAVVIWSLFTAGFGYATSAIHLFIARAGVAAGETGHIAAASLVGDYFSPQRRALALGFFFCGSALGMGLGYYVAGLLSDMYGWRVAFITVGLGGALLGPIALFSLPNPKRGGVEGFQVDNTNPINTGEALQTLWRRKAFVTLILSYSIAAIPSYGLPQWLPTFLMRKFELSTAVVGTYAGLFLAMPFLIGTIAGGFAANYLYKKDKRWLYWLPAIGLLLAGIANVIMVSSGSARISFIISTVPMFILGIYTAPLQAAIQELAGSRLRGTGIAVSSLMVLLCGQGFGPSLIGVASSIFDSLNAAGSHTSLGYGIATVTILCPIGAVMLLWSSRLFIDGIAQVHQFDRSPQGTSGTSRRLESSSPVSLRGE